MNQSNQSNKEKAALISEETLWQLYRALLRAHMLQQRLAAGGFGRVPPPRSAALAAALAQNLLPGDTLGLQPRDWTTRLLCGLPLAAIREAAGARSARPGKRHAAGPLWACASDAAHAVLPGTQAEQAALAVGAALHARLHATGSITVLVASGPLARAAAPASVGKTGPHAPDPPLPAWAQAATTAVSLRLPLLFLTESHAGSPGPSTDPRRPAPALPSIPVDRSDTIALYRVLYESAARARSGGGPTRIDCHDPVVAGSLRRSTTRPDTVPQSLAWVEQSLRARQLFTREQQRHLQRSVEKEFALAPWPLPPG